MLGLAVAITWFLESGDTLGVALGMAVVVLAGFLGWRLGDTFFENWFWS